MTMMMMMVTTNSFVSMGERKKEDVWYGKMIKERGRTLTKVCVMAPTGTFDNSSSFCHEPSILPVLYK
jgi:hypothetical protein